MEWTTIPLHISIIRSIGDKLRHSYTFSTALSIVTPLSTADESINMSNVDKMLIKYIDEGVFFTFVSQCNKL